MRFASEDNYSSGKGRRGALTAQQFELAWALLSNGWDRSLPYGLKADFKRRLFEYMVTGKPRHECYEHHRWDHRDPYALCESSLAEASQKLWRQLR